MNISNLDKCSNCGACSNVCPFSAIKINKTGLFYKPVVDITKCTNCGICVNACPIQNEAEVTKPIVAYGGWHKSNSVVLSSSSGGAFYGIAQYILSESGVVFGAAYSDDCRTVQFSSTDEVSLDKLQKSKYVESLVGKSFLFVRENLLKGRKVLFCGTPCQVAGLKAFLGQDYDNLITCDFACGGLPSHKIYDQYLIMLEKKYSSKVMAVDFRPKTHGWRRYAVNIFFENGKIYNRLGVEDPYLKSFLEGKLSVREYCLECKFSECHSSDISIADFWLHKSFSHLDNENGISLVVCNTKKGASIIERVKESYICETIKLQQATYNYSKTQTSNNLLKKREVFLATVDKLGFAAAYKKAFTINLKNRVRYIAARFVFKKRIK